MSNTHSPPARRAIAACAVALAALLALPPAGPAFAAAENGPRPRARAAAPGDLAASEPFRDLAERPGLSAATFRRLGSRHQVKSSGGVKATTWLGRWRAAGAEARGATVTLESPWGERLEIAMVLGDTALLAEINGRIQVRSTFGPDGLPQDLEVTAAGTTTRSHLGNSARLFAAGAPLPADLDLSAHQALAAALEDEMSPAFLREMANFERPAAEVGCYAQLAGCVGAMLAWAIDTALLPAACIVAGLPTFGVSCALAIIGHQLANATVISACTSYANCRGRTPGEEVDQSTPIILDMDGRGFHLTGLDDPVVFDLTADGVPDRVAWTDRGADEAFLVLDRNGNGRIDDGRELFGSHTPLVDGAAAGDGFSALTEHDLEAFGGNQNGRIDAGDAIFERLMLWTDRDRDGRSRPGELQRLAEAGVVWLSLDYRVDGRRDRHGNRFVLNGKALVRVGNRVQPRRMSDVYLKIEQ